MLNRHSTVLMLAGQPLPLTARLLMDRRRRAGEVAVDGETGAEVAASSGTWVLSDEGEASDGNIVVQEWDLSRAERSGVCVLYNHGRDPVLGAAVLGRWGDLRVVEGLPDTTGRALVGRIEWAASLPAQGAHVPRQVDEGMLRGVSVGWIPGAMTPRGELDPEHPHFREGIDDGCGPEEGYIMGSPEEPNELVETSLTPTPAQPRAYARARLVDGAERAVEGLLAGREIRAGDLDRLLAVVHDHPRVQRWLQRRDDLLIERLRAELARNPANLATPPKRPFWAKGS